MFDPVIFREYDIRGVFNQHFDVAFAKQLGFSFVQYARSKGAKGDKLQFTIGMDARLSSPALADAVAEGFREAGASVIRLGLVTSPQTYFSTFKLPNIAGGIMITGSHNPPEYNGFKISLGNQTIFGEEIQNLKKFFETTVPQAATKGSESSIDIHSIYLDHHFAEFGKLPSVPVVLDCGNGAAGVIARRLFERLGLKPIILFEEPDGTFPNHHPDPTVEKNLKDLSKKVLETGAAIGIGFDGDADRIGVVDAQGKMLYGDELMVIFARDILSRSKGSSIVGDVKCSDRLYADIQAHGGEPIMWKTGHSLIKEKIKTSKAPFGGEMSGHIFFADRNFGYDDAVYAGARICEILGRTGKSVRELLAGLPPAFCTPEIRIDTTESKKHLIVEKLKAEFATSTSEYQSNLLDGIRVSFKDGWALARASNTQPVLVLRFESETQAGMDRIQSTFMKIVEPLL